MNSVKIVRTEDGIDSLFSTEYNETYHSRFGVLQEAQIVFLEGSGVEKRLKENLPTKILEIGFGTGFNFFLTLSKAKLYNTFIDFISIEKNLLSYNTFSTLNHTQVDFAEEHNYFLDWRGSNAEDVETGRYNLEFQAGKLTLVIDDALKVNFEGTQFDAVYLDAFSPDVNPELWTVSFFEKIYSSMKPNAVMSTYSAKSSVKRAMIETGFKVQKKPGPPHKREFLIARK